MIRKIIYMLTGYASIELRRDILLELLGNGRVASLTYVDAKGVTQTRGAKLWIERHLTSGDRNIVGVNIPASLDERIFPYSDLKKDQFKSLRLDRLIRATGRGKTYEFTKL